MSLFVDVVTEITLPLVLLIGLGFLLQRRVAFDVTTLNRLVIYATLPALLIVSLADAELPSFEVEATIFFTLAQFFALMAIGWGLAALMRLDREVRPIIALAAAFANTGNFGIPVIGLALGPAFVPHQAIITAVLTVLILGFGPLVLSARAASIRGSLLAAFRTPLIPAIILGLLLNFFDVPLPAVLRLPLELVGGANTPAALIALGAQLGVGAWMVPRAAAALGVSLRLVLAPLATGAALLFLTLPDGLSDLFLIGAGAPVGILLPIFCAEYGGNPKLASAIVAISTALSPIAVTLLVYLARLN